MNRSLWSLIVLFLLVTGVTTLFIINNEFQDKITPSRPGFSVRPVKSSKILPKPQQVEGTATADIQIPPEQIAALIDSSLKNIENNRINDAEDNIRTALVFDPENMRALTILGRIKYARREFVKAELIFRKQLEIDPQNATVMNNLGSSLAKQKKIIQALEFAQKAHQADPDSPEIMLNLAGLYAMNGHPQESITLLKMVHKIIGPALIPLSMDKSFDSIRKEPGFVNLLKLATQQYQQHRGKHEQN